MGYRLDGRGSSPSRRKFFLFSTVSGPALGPTQTHIEWAPGNISQGVKRLAIEVDHRPKSNAEDKNDGAIPPLPHTSSWRGA
jgi:hypothetical protein